ncbi:hypothetical protein PHMEG_0008377 [Phytophthora megakarya]|uniref:Uncharacterized protein n=1 Tax=Phytophthora megakarya TaxID=4795 RepID=A0A225WLD5_9STRA|nr:hypothetical protein PHMEG_0008377 [Phytophthora megakarya]
MAPEEASSSLYRRLHFSLGLFTADYTSLLTEFMNDLEVIHGLFNADYITSTRDRTIEWGELELFAASPFHKSSIEVKTLNDNCKVMSTFTYTVPQATKKTVWHD